MTFSERIGIKTKQPIQLESIDNSLRNSLFNVSRPFLLEGLAKVWAHEREPCKSRFNLMWADFFKLPLHQSPANFSGDNKSSAFLYDFFEKKEWYKIYDAVEYLVKLSEGSLSNSFNQVLEREVSGYRVLNGIVTPISDAAQIDAIQTGLDASNNQDLAVVNSHLATALRLLSDRTNPDFRNSIKEAISAIESLTSILTNKKKPAIKDALRELENSGKLHPALNEAFKKLYGWSSDEDGVRHALMEDSTLDFADAQFMLVSCSAFVHLLIAKTSKIAE